MLHTQAKPNQSIINYILYRYITEIEAEIAL